MFFKTLTVLLSLAGAVTPYPSSAKRDSSDLKLYAYGTGISGLQVYGGDDGKAYLSTESADNLTELIWPEPDMNSPWNATVMAKNSTSDKATFYVVITDSAFDPAGFHRANDTAPTGASMKGFFRYGSQIMHANDGTYESKFWAQETSVDGLYKLIWNVNNVDKDDAIPVTIKTASS